MKKQKTIFFQYKKDKLIKVLPVGAREEIFDINTSFLLQNLKTVT